MSYSYSTYNMTRRATVIDVVKKSSCQMKQMLAELHESVVKRRVSLTGQGVVERCDPPGGCHNGILAATSQS